MLVDGEAGMHLRIHGVEEGSPAFEISNVRLRKRMSYAPLCNYVFWKKKERKRNCMNYFVIVVLSKKSI